MLVVCGSAPTGSDMISRYTVGLDLLCWIFVSLRWEEKIANHSSFPPSTLMSHLGSFAPIAHFPAAAF